MSTAADPLPGADLVEAGIADLSDGRESAPALLVAMAAPRLRDLGFDVPEDRRDVPPSHRLYDLLEREGHDAHSRYNALVARMVSFARAAEHARPR